MIMTRTVQRVVKECTVRIHGYYYFSQDLKSLLGQKVDVTYIRERKRKLYIYPKTVTVTSANGAKYYAFLVPKEML